MMMVVRLTLLPGNLKDREIFSMILVKFFSFQTICIHKTAPAVRPSEKF